LGRSWAFSNAFWSIWGRFWIDFLSFFDRFESHFLMIFGIVFENSDFVKISVSPRREHYFQGFEQRKNVKQTGEKST